MVLAASEAFSKTFGLIVTFGGIGVVVNIILVYIAVQVRGERRQNEEYIASRQPPHSET
jgi:heme/copper-type cytochrome/quinol oxidase subunit 2